MFTRRNSYKFKGREHSKHGIIAMLLSLFVFICFTVISFISGSNQGNGGMELGLIGIACAAIAVWGFIIGIKSFKEKDIYFTAPIIGTVLNGIMIVVFFSLYIVGILI